MLSKVHVVHKDDNAKSCPCKSLLLALQQPKNKEGAQDGARGRVQQGQTVHGDAGDTSGVDGDELVSMRRTTRMHKEDAWQDDMLHLEGAKRVHGMTMDTTNTLVVVDPFNN